MTAAQRLLKCHPASTGSTGSTGNQQNGLAISYTAHQPCKIHSNGAQVVGVIPCDVNYLLSFNVRTSGVVCFFARIKNDRISKHHSVEGTAILLRQSPCILRLLIKFEVQDPPIASHVFYPCSSLNKTFKGIWPHIRCVSIFTCTVFFLAS